MGSSTVAVIYVSDIASNLNKEFLNIQKVTIRLKIHYKRVSNMLKTQKNHCVT